MEDANADIAFGELHELNMASLAWTHVQTGKTKPRGRYSCSWNAITHDQLLLHGGAGSDNKTLSDTWVLDLSSKTWKQYKAGDYPRNYHTGSTCINSNSILIGGTCITVSEDNNYCDNHRSTFYITLEPTSLQQLAMKTINKHYNFLSWQCLPKKLIALLGMSSNEENDLEI